MSNDDLFAAVRRHNPWWGMTAWEAQDRQLRALAAIPFHYDPQPLRGILPGSVYSLLGPRRVGKSTAVKVAIRDLLARGYPARRVFYYPCDLLRTPQELARLIEAIYDEAQLDGSLGEADQPFYIFLDEVQTIPGWQLAVKYLHDNTRFGDDCVVLTGSSARSLREGGELLPGRRGSAADRDRLLYPMSFRQFLQITQPDLLLPEGGFTPQAIRQAIEPNSPVRESLSRPRAKNALSSLVRALEDYARCGGFPTAVANWRASGEVGDTTLRELWDVVRGDLLRYHQVRDATLPLKVLERLALNLASPVSWQTLAREAAIDPGTVQTYVELFADAYLFLVVHRTDQGVLARRADRKIYPIDPLIIHLPTAVTGRQRFSPDGSLLIESLVAVALTRALQSDPIATYGIGHELLYYRTSRGREIDFLAGMARDPFEVKYQESVDRRDTQVMHQSFGHGVLVTKQTLSLEGPILMIPAALLLTILR